MPSAIDPPVSPTPLLRYALQDINSPNHTDGFYVELVNKQDSAYQKETPIKRGTPYANILGADARIIAQYSGNPLYFLKQTADVESMRVMVSSDYDQFVIWIWATDQLAQDTCNAEVAYMEESAGVPRYIRESTIRRKDYDANPALAYLGTLTGLMSVAITAAGTGYTQATGTIGNATAQAVCLAGAIVDWIVTIQGSSITSGGTLTITGDGTGATATARIQPAGAVLVSQKKVELPEDDPRSHDYVKVLRVYEFLPGVVLTTHERSVQVRGRTVDVTKQKGAIGTLSVETGNLIISSKTTPQDANTEVRVTEKVASLPPNESWAYWDYVPIPTLVFDIVNALFCNFSAQFTVTTTPVTQGGASAFRKHRMTVGYSTTYPNPDLSGSTPVIAQLIFKGKLINFSFSNVLNDAITYSEVFSYAGEGGCTWTEEYDFSASYPSATAYAAGDWYVREFQVEPWGDSGFRFRKVEYYSAPGNPSI